MSATNKPAHKPTPRGAMRQDLRGRAVDVLHADERRGRSTWDTDGDPLTWDNSTDAFVFAPND